MTFESAISIKAQTIALFLYKMYIHYSSNKKKWFNRKYLYTLLILKKMNDLYVPMKKHSLSNGLWRLLYIKEKREREEDIEEERERDIYMRAWRRTKIYLETIC